MTDYVEFHNRNIDIQDHLSTTGMQFRFKSVEDIICVGAASYEGTEEEENNRAKQRSEQLLVWVKESVPTMANLYTLNLGQYNTCHNCNSPLDSAYQRRIILIGVTKKDEGVNLEEALKSALDTHKGLPVQYNWYSNFELENKI